MRILIGTAVLGLMMASVQAMTVEDGLRQEAKALRPQAVKAIMTAVADWQLANPVNRRRTDWTHGALFAGLVALGQMPGCERYLEVLKAIGQENNWQLGPRPYHADDHCVGQMYIALYRIYRDPNMVGPLKERFDWILANPSDVTLEYGKQQGKDRWWWCDALFMAPPFWAGLADLTGQRRYLDFMDKEWWATTDYLYDKQEHLYLRDSRFFERREANGQKVFWSRGNGWVFAGLVRVLDLMPKDHPNYDRYRQLYLEMAQRLIQVQGEDGLWRSSLLDPNAYPVPESSGSGFFCYGLAWGCNKGWLGESYKDAVIKAWRGLLDCVHADGKLGYVQPIGDSPNKVNADSTDIYGIGAFLLAASEVYKMAVDEST
ncbi:MAG: glycoside hydrolase family 88 protein [Sedimentisphaerales bacterium]|nr:glycoside hydrolase family 88 protein [Sedimentisphaerales bacterium]